MRKGFLLLVFLGMLGCESSPPTPPPPPPKPTIRVERQEDVNGVVLIIWYDDHHRDHLGNHNYTGPYARFCVSNKEELQEYKRQLEFLLSQIEEVEKRMTVHEPEGPTASVP